MTYLNSTLGNSNSCTMNWTSEEAVFASQKGVFHASTVDQAVLRFFSIYMTSFCFVKLLIPNLLTILTAKALQERISWKHTPCFCQAIRADTLVLYNFLFFDTNVTQGARTGLWMSSFLSV